MVYLHFSRGEHHLRFRLVGIVCHTEGRAQSGGHCRRRTYNKWLFSIFSHLKISVTFQPYYPVGTIEIIGHTQSAGAIEKRSTAIGQCEMLALTDSRLDNCLGLRLNQCKCNGAVNHVVAHEKQGSTTYEEECSRNSQPPFCTA